MDTTTLAQTLTCAEALKWLEGTLNDPDNEDLDPDEAMRAILERDWETEEEFLEFFKQISIELARTATQSADYSTASLFGVDLPCNLGLDSPYQKLWEKALHTNSQKFKEEVSTARWNTCIDSGIDRIPASCLIPLATAYEESLFEQLRSKSIQSLTSDQEIFLGYVTSMLSSGYFESEIPEALINIPSSKVLAEIFYDWTSHSKLWVPYVIKEVLKSEYADKEVKAQISNHLKGEQVEEEEAWQEHLEYYWSSEDIEEVLSLCEISD
jgi:hypothetical protein